MSRWQLQGTGDYYARYSAYEKYLRANAKDLGLSEAQVNEQLGRYSEGLQQKLQYEPQNRAVGKDIAKNPAEYGINPNNVTTELEKTQKQLEVMKKDLGKGATSTTYYGTPEQLRSAAPLGNIAPEIPVKSEFEKALEKSQLFKSTNGNSVDRLGKRKQKQILEEIENLGKLAKTEDEINELKRRVGLFKGGNDSKLFNEAVDKQAAELDKKAVKAEQKSSEPKTWEKYTKEHGTKYNAPETFGGVEADRKAQEIIESNKNKSQVIVDDLADDAAKMKPQAEAVDDILDDAARMKPQAEAVDDIFDDAARMKPQAETVDDILDDAAKLKPEAEAASKESKGFMNSVKNAVKGKKGKIALAAGALAVIGAGAYALFGGKGDEKVETPAAESPVPVKTTEKPQQEKTQQESKPVAPSDSIPEEGDVTPVVPAPVGETEEPKDTEKTEKEEPVVPADDATETEEAEEGSEQVNKEEYVVKKGDSFWKLAEKYLIDAHKDEPNYKPTNKEIYDLTMKFLKDNNYKLDENNYYPNPMLHPGDKLNLAA